MELNETLNLPDDSQSRGRPNSMDDHLMVGSTNSIFALLPIVMPKLIQLFFTTRQKFLKVQGSDWEC